MIVVVAAEDAGLSGVVLLVETAFLVAAALVILTLVGGGILGLEVTSFLIGRFMAGYREPYQWQRRRRREDSSRRQSWWRRHR
jgi:hypothetical protein